MFKLGDAYISINERYDIVEFVSATKIAVFRERPEGRMISHYVGTEDEIALVREFVDLGAEFNRRDITSGAMRRRMERALDANDDPEPTEQAMARALDRVAMAVERVGLSMRRRLREESTTDDPLKPTADLSLAFPPPVLEP